MRKAQRSERLALQRVEFVKRRCKEVEILQENKGRNYCWGRRDCMDSDH